MDMNRIYSHSQQSECKQIQKEFDLHDVHLI